MTAIPLDLADTRVDRRGRRRRVDGPVDALFSCAGVADGTPGIEKINFLGHRYMIERLLEARPAPRGSAIGMISSAAGFGWEPNLETVHEYLDDRRLRRGRRVGPRATARPTTSGASSRHQRLRGPQGACDAPEARASASTPSSPGPPTPRWPRPTPTRGSASAPTTARRPASRRPPRSSRPTRWCSCAATPPPAITGGILVTDAGYFAAGMAGSFQPAARRRRLHAQRLLRSLPEPSQARRPMCAEQYVMEPVQDITRPLRIASRSAAPPGVGSSSCGSVRPVSWTAVWCVMASPLFPRGRRGFAPAPRQRRPRGSRAGVAVAHPWDGRRSSGGAGVSTDLERTDGQSASETCGRNAAPIDVARCTRGASAAPAGECPRCVLECGV